MKISLSCCIIFSLYGCAAQPTHLVSQSWDQQNLKNHDVGCPTAVYIAPKGELIECQQPIVTTGQAGTTTFYPGGADPTVALASVGGEVAPTAHGFKTAEDAATAALKSIAAKPTSFYYEWGGYLARDTKSGEYFYHNANTSMHGDHVQIEEPDDLPETFEVVGTFHTHPCLPRHEVTFFSPADLMEGLFEHELVFMGDFCTGAVHEFKPGDKPDVEKMPHSDLWSTHGRIVGKFSEPRQELVVE
jgi:hypothetical protein